MGLKRLTKGKGSTALRAGLAALALLGGAGAGQAQGGLFTPPEGCKTYLTVQSRSCVVTNHFVCPQIDPDHRFRTDFGEAGPYFTSRIDGDGQWIESGPPEAPTRTRTVRPIRDPGSVSELIENGLDSFDFTQRSTIDGPTRVTGFDRIIGEIEIDGEKLYRTEFEMTRSDASGRVIEHVRGREYVSDKHKRFFAGFAADVTDDARQTNARDRSPVEFIYPGEQGFRGIYPRHDCDLMSGLESDEPRLRRAAARRSTLGIPRFIVPTPKEFKAERERLSIAGPWGRPADDAAAFGLVPRPVALLSRFDGSRLSEDLA